MLGQFEKPYALLGNDASRPGHPAQTAEHHDEQRYMGRGAEELQLVTHHIGYGQQPARITGRIFKVFDVGNLGEFLDDPQCQIRGLEARISIEDNGACDGPGDGRKIIVDLGLL